MQKVYIRSDAAGVPVNVNLFAVWEGCRQLGIDTAPWVGGDPRLISDLPSDLGEETALAGFVGDVLRALDAIKKPRPEPIDYPPPLREFLGRMVERRTMRDFRTGQFNWDRELSDDELKAVTGELFVKPVAHKRFNGGVWCPAKALETLSIPDDEPVWLSPRIDFRSEYRAFVLNSELLDVRRYRGDWAVAPDSSVVVKAIREYLHPGHSYGLMHIVAPAYAAPSAFALDFGITSDARTLLVEANDAFALGTYGLHPAHSARMFVRRWEELCRAWK